MSAYIAQNLFPETNSLGSCHVKPTLFQGIMIAQLKTQAKYMSSSSLTGVPLKRQTRYFWKKETITLFTMEERVPT